MEFELPKLTEKEVSIGLNGIITYSNSQSKDEQLGYSISIDGELLFGFEEGDWQESWYVIGRDTLCGDPIFVDLNDRDIPVFTAMHGMGEWQETCISDTYEGFLKSLSKLEDESDRNLSDNDMMIVLKEIKNYIGDAHLEFWESIIRIKI